MAPTTQFFADLARLLAQLGQQAVQQCRLAHTGVAGKCTKMAVDQFFQPRGGGFCLVYNNQFNP
ncbi:hypothetical protein SDC9_194642 [bioreactor metagenome]|uniref:Uncharacterized protein n=1 Tax=bioreactor metagenome TaxID=1076179 RepID=A0A645I8C2_9ZZZZ